MARRDAETSGGRCETVTRCAEMTVDGLEMNAFGSEMATTDAEMVGGVAEMAPRDVEMTALSL